MDGQRPLSFRIPGPREGKAMTVIRRIALGTLVTLAALVLVLAWFISHDAGPAPLAPIPPQAARMKALVFRQYGGPEVLRIEEVVKPSPKPDELLIRVHAASLNPLDWHRMRGLPYPVRLLATGIGRPRLTRLGVDFAGSVEAVGAQVRHFRVGDEVFGTADGAVAAYVTSTEVGLALKPANSTFEQAAAVPIAGLTALQGLRDKGQLKAGQKLLINGASGGVGTFAVQIGKSMGAEVTGVCSTRNQELVRLIGADHVVDYTREDVTRGNERFDLVLDMVGSHPLLAYRRVLNPHGTLVVVGSPSTDRWIGAMSGWIKATFIRPFVGQHYDVLMADANRTQDLDALAELMRSGRVTPVIDRTYALADAAEAMRYLEQGHARGKIIIRVD
jgi:NADPH:quinone reductase-like Zn-dependent oxidoreductase